MNAHHIFDFVQTLFWIAITCFLLYQNRQLLKLHRNALDNWKVCNATNDKLIQDLTHVNRQYYALIRTLRATLEDQKGPYHE